jgi:hypothetical protein
MMTQPNTTSTGAVPDLVKIRPIQTDQTMDVQTSILEPIVANDRFVRFQLDNKGILHSNSKIQLSLGKDLTAQRFLPLGNGIGATIRRCCLYAGSKIIAEVDDWNHFHAYKSMFLSNESKKEREAVLTGRVGCYEYDYDPSQASLAASELRLDLDKDYDPTNGVTLPETLDLTKKQTFQVNLSDLFPFLKQTQLPLFLMKDQLSVELHFEDQKHRYFAPQALTADNAKVNTALAVAVEFDHSKTKLIADYMIYPQDQMDNYARQVETQGITIPYYDYLLTRSNLLPQANTLNFVRTVGGANRICTKMIVANTREFRTNCIAEFNNVYNSTTKNSADPSDKVEIQIKYNDHNLFPRPLSNQALLFNHLQACEGVPPFITKFEYDGTHEGMISQKKVEGYQLRDELALSPKNYMAFQLNRQERVNSRGVELSLTGPFANANAAAGDLNTQFTYTQRVWLEVAKVITLKNGRMMCTDA